MTATPAYVPEIGPPFQAKYSGECYGCGEPFEVGTMLRYKDDNLYVDHTCDSDGPVYVTEKRSDGRAPINVMPTGKTARDRCDQCFIIHTTNQTECY